MTNLESHDPKIPNQLNNHNNSYDMSYYLAKIENNAKEFDLSPKELKSDENFVIQALQKNSLVTRFITDEHLANDKIAFSLSLIISDHANILKNRLQEDDFYFHYISQKIKNNEIDNKKTYINKKFFSKEENILKVIKESGFFSLRYIHDELKDKEHIVDMFCSHSQVNEIWASDRIKKEAIEGGANVSKYVKSKLFYEKLGNKFDKKPETKSHKI